MSERRSCSPRSAALIASTDLSADPAHRRRPRRRGPRLPGLRRLGRRAARRRDRRRRMARARRRDRRRLLRPPDDLWHDVLRRQPGRLELAGPGPRRPQPELTLEARRSRRRPARPAPGGDRGGSRRARCTEIPASPRILRERRGQPDRLETRLHRQRQPRHLDDDRQPGPPCRLDREHQCRRRALLDHAVRGCEQPGRRAPRPPRR